MIYLNNHIKKDTIDSIFKEINTDDAFAIDQALKNNQITFASIKRFDDGSFEILYKHSYILLGPLGGVQEASGKYEKFKRFDKDLEEFEKVLEGDIRTIMSGTIDVINLG